MDFLRQRDTSGENLYVLNLSSVLFLSPLTALVVIESTFYKDLKDENGEKK